MTEATTRHSHQSEIELLTPDVVSRIRLPWDARYSQRELHRIATTSPNLSVWNSRSGDFLIGGLWRHRPEIATVFDVYGAGATLELIEAFVKQAARLGLSLAILSEYVESRTPEFYGRAGFEHLEEIVIYEIGGIRRPRTNDVSLSFERVDTNDTSLKQQLIELDNQSFPWLWKNCEAEFENYLHAPGVSVWVTRDEAREPLAYVGVTALRSWGHLDRIAVRPDRQGEGLGRSALDFAIAHLVTEGTRRIGLSTQARNTVSRRLYESYGFRRAARHDYRLWGRWLIPAPDRPE